MPEGQFMLELGARLLEGGTAFRVWAPRAKRVEVILPGAHERIVSLLPESDGYFAAEVEGVAAGSDYFYRLDSERKRPDPVSRHQPAGVHGPSRVVDPNGFAWSDTGWAGRAFDDFVVYELHVGTFTAEGTFDAAIERLKDLVDLGVTAVELMPVAAFPGERNWGYDGAYLFAPQHSYGGPLGLKRLVDACHAHGLALVLDVVYNHIGPEGNYLGEYGPYFTDRYRTPWGAALNYDGADSDAVRRFILDNARYWLSEYHIDGLRLDAIHGIFDFSALHLLAEMQQLVAGDAATLGRPLVLIAESDLNDVRVIDPPSVGGHGLAAQWSDDLHHSLWTLLGGGGHGYFADFGAAADLGKALSRGFVYDGRRSEFRHRRHGSSAAGRPGRQLVVYIQNHDQVANASQGSRIATRLDCARERLAAVVLTSSPNTPLLFMGQEYGETNPFFYFVDHGDPGLSEAVRDGRRREMEELGFGDAFADPTEPRTFERSKLEWRRRDEEPHAGLLRLYRELLALRRSSPAMRDDRPGSCTVQHDDAERWLAVERVGVAGDRMLLLANFSAQARDIPVGTPGAAWSLAISTEAERFGGAGSLPAERMAGPSGALQRVSLPPFSAGIWLAARAGAG